jgi:feruloyl esterase
MSKVRDLRKNSVGASSSFICTLMRECHAPQYRKRSVQSIVLALITMLTVVVGTRTCGATVPRSCDRLASIALPHATITLAQLVAPAAPAQLKTEAVGSSDALAKEFPNLPAFCRVVAILKPSKDSDIRIEVWLPAKGWNGKFEAVGNGGFAGTIPYQEIADAVAAGYAGAGTDTGHTENNGDFALGHEQKLIDFGYRAIHQMTTASKAIIKAYYGTFSKLAYFNGCSTGGRQALVEAQKFPDDFNGIVAGAASWNQLRLHAARIALNVTVNKDPRSVIPPGKYPMIHAAVLEACDTLDGVKDGVITDPARCHFDYGALLCHGKDAAGCLTKGQVESARAMTTPIVDPSTSTVLYPGHFWPGSELGWGYIGGPKPSSEAVSAMKNIVIGDRSWDYHTMHISADVARATRLDQGAMNSGDPNLTSFFGHGGKLLMYHGWSDPIITPQNSIFYYDEVMKSVGKVRAANSIKLFMVPGMNHCDSGPGTDTFDKVAAIDQWVQSGRRPNAIVASHSTNGKPDRTRPLCPYPQVAVYKGVGNTDEAAAFVCKVR